MNRVTFKFYLRKDQQNKLGESPVYLRLTINRKHKYIATGIYLLQKYWDEVKESVVSNMPNSRELDLYFANYKTNIKRTILNIQNSGKTPNFANVLPKVNYREQGKDFIAFSEEWLKANPKDLSDGTLGRYHSNLETLKRKHANSLLTNSTMISLLLINNICKVLWEIMAFRITWRLCG